MSTIALRPHSRSLFQRSLYACQQCRRVDSPRWHSHGNQTGGFKAFQKTVPGLDRRKPSALPDKPARTRFAPSPTGYLHIGSLRTALYNYLLARATGGQFIIRIEDTDRTRVVDDAIPRLLAELRWADLKWDEGPDIGGPFGPYEQSQRLDKYDRYITQLIESGKAYRCFCSSHDLERHKKQSLTGGSTANYPGTCRSIPPDQAERRAGAGEPHVVRFRSDKRHSFIDLVYGKYWKNEDEDDFILIKRDGYPTYHFANVVDDHLMEITHVIRGAEWLISTPKHIALYDAFQWEPPAFAHAGLLCANNGEKLSKRNHDVDISLFRDQGFLPSAMNNWLVLHGWSMQPKDLVGKDPEVLYDTKTLAEKFTLKFTKGNIKTDYVKLQLFQSRHLKRLLTDPDADETVIARAIVPPVIKILNEVCDLLAQQKEERLVSPVNPEVSISTTDMSCLVPQLANPSTAPGQLLRIFRAFAASASPIDAVYRYPSLFFRPSAAVYARKTLSRSLGKLTDLGDGLGDNVTVEELLADLRATFEAIPEKEWGADRLQDAMFSFAAKHAVEVTDENGVKTKKDILTAMYTLTRLVVTGATDRPMPSSKMVLSILGREETLLRFKLCGV